jgi:hypothetical protein
MSSIISVSPAKLEALKSKIKEAFPESVTMADISQCIITSMSLVGQIEQISGHQKKDLVIDLVIYCCVTEGDNGPLESLEPVLKFVVPQIIDKLILVENGKLKFNSERVKSFFSKVVKSLSCCK